MPTLRSPQSSSYSRKEDLGDLQEMTHLLLWLTLSGCEQRDGTTPTPTAPPSPQGQVPTSPREEGKEGNITYWGILNRPIPSTCQRGNRPERGRHLSRSQLTWSGQTQGFHPPPTICTSPRNSAQTEASEPTVPPPHHSHMAALTSHWGVGWGSKHHSGRCERTE